MERTEEAQGGQVMPDPLDLARSFVTLCNASCGGQPRRHSIVYQRGLQVLCAICLRCGYPYLDDTERM